MAKTGIATLPVVIEHDPRPEVRSIGGALEGAERTSRETMLWAADRRPPDSIIHGVKDEADARGREVVTNDGHAQGIVDINRDSIVGNQYRLNAQPNWTVLQSVIDRRFDEKWAEEYQLALEEKFNLIAESDECWLDASRQLTFTAMIRMSVAVFVYTGEALGTAEWIREVDRPFYTAVQLISPSRLSNPDGAMNDRFLRDGVKKDDRGKPLGYYIRVSDPYDVADVLNQFRWTYVPARKNLIPGAPPMWNRKMVIHVKDSVQPNQTRGISALVAVLKEMRMTRKFRDITLQNAIVNASYAATIESELPSEVVAAAMGAGAAGDVSTAFMNFIGSYLSGLDAYLKNANAVAVDGAKMPHLFPGTKLNARNLGTPGGVGTDFETSLLRHTCAGLGISYEEFANDWSKTNYSSGKASALKTWKHMSSRKKFVADKVANEILSLFVEEDLNAGNLPLPRGWDSRIFYMPYGKEALLQCDWIGAGRGQIDELKETQAALLRINGRLSTHEQEIAKQGGDYRKTFRQISREERYAKSLSLELAPTAGGKTVERDGSTGGNTVTK